MIIVLLALITQAPDTAGYTAAQCPSCAGWNAPAQPRRLFGNTYYVGTRELGALLITSDSGHVLIDGGLPNTAPLIMASIRALGFRLEDIRIIANTHAHSDHAGGLAALQRASGAEPIALGRAAGVIRSGHASADDPQSAIALDYPAVRRVREIRDGEVVSVGSIRLTAHATEGHSPGGTSWSWRSCEGAVCRDFVYGDSQTPVAADGFRYGGGSATAGFVIGFRALEMMRCEILVTPHPSASRFWERIEGSEPLADASACKRYAAAGRERLARRLTTESAGDDGAFLARPAGTQLRVMTWNVGANAVFSDPGPRGWRNSDGLRGPRFRRVARAVQPDVVCLNEIFEPRTAADAAALLDSTLPLPGGRRWQAHKFGDAVIVSRFALADMAGRNEDFGAGPRAHATARVAVPDAPGGRGMYVACAHFQSRGDSSQIASRQRQAEALVEWSRGLPAGTPLVFMGDWNAYRTDPTLHMRTLAEGANLSDAAPLQNARGPASFTFGNGSGENPPGELDRVLYSTGRFRLLNAFVLNTAALSAATLARLGLQADDILLHAERRLYDHWPVVADLGSSSSR